MPTAELHGPPVLRQPALEWGPVNPEDHDGEIIDIKTTSHQGATTEHWWHRFSTVEEGLVTRYYEEERGQRDPENNEFIRTRQYEEEFNQDKQGYFTRLVSETDPTEWATRLAEVQADLTNLLTLLDQGESNIQASVRSHLNMAALGGQSGIGDEASIALGKLLTTMAEGKADTQKAKTEANQLIKKLLQVKGTIYADLLTSDAKTRFDELSPETKAFIYRQFTNFRFKQDEGTDMRTARLRVLREMRKNSPYRVFDGGDRFAWDGVEQGWDIIDQLKTENDPKVRASLEKELKRLKAQVRRWTSSIAGTWNERLETSPVDIQQVQNAAWAKFKGTVNRMRHPGQDEQTPGPVKRSTIVRHTASFSDFSWESEYLESEISLHYGASWNAYYRLQQMTGDERAHIINNFFDRRFLSKTIDVDSDINAKVEKEAELRKDEYDALLAERIKEQEKLPPVAGQALTDFQQELQDLIARQAEIRTDMTDLTSDYQASGIGPQRQRGRQQQQQPQQQQAHMTFEKYNVLRSQLKEELESVTTKILKAREDERKAQARIDQLSREMEKLNTRYHLFDTPNNIGLYGNDPANPSLNHGELETRQRVARGADSTLSGNAAERRFSEFMDKLQRYIVNDDYKDFHVAFNDQEIAVIATLNGIGTAKNRYRGNRLQLKPDMVEYGTGVLNLKEKHFVGNNPNQGYEKDADGNDVLFDIIVDDDYKAEYNFINPSSIPEWKGRLSVDAMAQILRHPERYPKLAKFVQYMKDNNTITLELSFPVKHDANGGMEERPIEHTGRALNIEAAVQLKELHNWTNVDLYRAWISNPRIQEELGIRPDELVARMVAEDIRVHDWERELLAGFTVFNLSNSTAIPATTEDDAPMFFEYMLMRQFEMYGRLNSEDVDGQVLYQLLPRSNEWSYTFNKADNTRETHWRDQIITNGENAPKTEADLYFQSLMTQLELYENRTRYYNNARVPAGSMDYDETVRVGAYIKAHVDLIQQKMIRLRAVYENPDPALTIVERIRQLDQFRETEMAHLSYEILDKKGRPKLGQRNSELWQYYNATAQWLGKLKRNQRESEDRYVATLTNPRRHAQVNGVSAMELAETDYLYNKDERLNWELEVYALGLEATGQTQSLNNKQASSLLADRYADIDSEQFVRVNKKHARAVLGYDQDLGPTFYQEWGRAAMGKFATSFICEFGRRLTLRLNEIGRTVGVNLNLPADRFMLNLRPDQIEEILIKKKDHELYRRLTRRMSLGIKTGHQDSWLGVVQRAESNDLYRNVGATDFELDRVGEDLLRVYKTRRRDDFNDALDRFLLLYGMDFLQDAKIGGMPIKEALNVVNRAPMNDTDAMELDPTGRWQLNPYGKRGTRMDTTDWVLLQLTAEAAGRPMISPSPLDTRYGPVNTNNPTAIEQYYQSLVP